MPLLGQSTRTFPKVLNWATNVCSDISHATPPRKTLHESWELLKRKFFWKSFLNYRSSNLWLSYNASPRRGSFPDQLTVAQLTAEKYKMVWKIRHWHCIPRPLRAWDYPNYSNLHTEPVPALLQLPNLHYCGDFVLPGPRYPNAVEVNHCIQIPLMRRNREANSCCCSRPHGCQSAPQTTG